MLTVPADDPEEVIPLHLAPIKDDVSGLAVPALVRDLGEESGAKHEGLESFRLDCDRVIPDLHRILDRVGSHLVSFYRLLVVG
jgi:hypothetical protein